MTNEMPHELSEEQPPAWQGKPSDPNPDPQLVVPPAPTRSENRLDFGALLGRVWEVLKTDWRKYFSQAFIIAAGFSLLAMLMISIGVQNLSDEAWALLNGESPQISEQPTTAELEALFALLVEVFSLLGWLMPALLIAQLIISGLSTKIALNHPYYDLKIESVPWVRLITANIAVTLILVLLFAPMIVAFVTNQISLGVLLALIATGVAIWFAIGIILVTPVVLDSNLGGINAVRSALSIAKGNRLAIVGVSLLVGIIGSLLASTLTQFLSLLPASGEALWYFVVTNFIPLALSLPLSAIAASVLYLNYKNRD